MESIRNLNELSPHTLFIAFNQAFSDYEMQLNKDELEGMLKRRGFIPALSFGAFQDGVLVSFTLNGIGNFNGEKSAYDTGTGTLKEYRGRGLASRVFNYSIPFLKEAGISQYILEVLQHNVGAISVYKKLGFEVVREFNYFTGKPNEVLSGNSKPDSNIHIKSIDLKSREKMTQFWDFKPSWQNNFESISRSRSEFIIKGAFQKEELVGYAVFEPLSGDITQIAVDKNHRRKGIASALLQETLILNENSGVKAINTEISCESISGFLKSVNVPLAGKQYEMRRQL